MDKFVSLPLEDDSTFIVNTSTVIALIEKDGFGCLILNQIPFRAPCDTKLLNIDEAQPIRTKLSLEELSALFGVIKV